MTMDVASQTSSVDDIDTLPDDEWPEVVAVEQRRVGTKGFQLPPGPDETEVWLTTDGGGVFTTIGQLREMHEDICAPPKLQSASATTIRPRPRVEREWRPYDQERKARKERIAAYLRSHPMSSGNKIIAAISGNRGRLRQDIAEMLADDVIRRGANWGLFLV